MRIPKRAKGRQSKVAIAKYDHDMVQFADALIEEQNKKGNEP